MHVRCPHCHNPVEILDDSSLKEIACPSCGSSFSLVGDETCTYRGDELKTVGHFQLVNYVGSGADGADFGVRWPDTALALPADVRL